MNTNTLRRFLERLEAHRLSPRQAALIFSSLILIRLEAEVLFLDPNRSTDFFVFNFWYFFSLLFSLVLLGAILTRQPVERVFSVSISCAGVILIPLLDRLFYPRLTADQLLPLCTLPVFPSWQPYLSYLFTQVLSHQVFLDPGISFGLRLEVLLICVAVGIYAFLRSQGRLDRWVKAAVAYLVCLFIIVVHGLLVVHPATRRWVFPPLVFAELAGLVAFWNPAVLRAWWQNLALLEVLLLVIFAGVGFLQADSPAARHPEQLGNVVAATTAVMFLGVFLGQAKSRNTATPGDPVRQDLVFTFAPVGCGLAGALAGTDFFVSLLMLMGLVYLVWLSGLSLPQNAAVSSLLAALALWVAAWAGYVTAQAPPFNSPLPPPLMAAMPGSGPAEFGDFGPPPGIFPPPGATPNSPPFFGVPPGSGSSQKQGPVGSRLPPPPGLFQGFGGSRVLHPPWLCHPLWLALPLVLWASMRARRALKGDREGGT